MSPTTPASLYATLAAASTEEDVKDAYVQALGLARTRKGLIDIQTAEIWFEAKLKATSVYVMFTQLLHYVNDAIKKGQPVPPFLCVIDTAKAALLKTSDVLPLFGDKAIKWSQKGTTSASQFDTQTLQAVSTFIGTHFVQFNIATHEQEFIDTVQQAVKTGLIIRTHITPDNLKQVFDRWITLIGRELASVDSIGVDEADYALLFFADIMHDGSVATHDDLPAQMFHDGQRPVFVLQGKTYKLVSAEGYRQFWLIYHKPPKSEYRNYLLERRDSLIPLDERSFKGAYYTPLHVVDKAYDLLAQTLGKNWQQNYIVWDMCCGVGNLEVKHSNHRNVFMSTLDQADVDLMRANRTCVSSNRFQYDYLNEDITDFCTIDYSLSNKVPRALQQAIADFKAGVKGAKKILVLMNPPYAEAGSALGNTNKQSVAKTRAAGCMMTHFGKAKNELFAQFMARIQFEIPGATVALFSKLKYVNSPNFEAFRAHWKANYLGGFVVHSKAFDGLKGNFPIGFLVWDTLPIRKITKAPAIASIEPITTTALDKNARILGDKEFHNLPADSYLNVWLARPKANSTQVVPLKNAVSVYDKTKALSNWSEGAIGYMWCQNNDLQHTGQQTALFSSVWGDGHGFYITAENLWQAAIVFAVRRLVKPTWLNDRDQFLQPSEPLPAAFKRDCLIWMLFNGSNLAASANDLAWNGSKWSIVNHFIPFTELQVGAPARFESDFMVQYLQAKPQTPLSVEAAAVMAQGLALWRAYFAQTDAHTTRTSLKLNRPDVGWYQVRKALEARKAAGTVPTDFAPFKAAYEALGDKLRPQVYTLGFMR